MNRSRHLEITGKNILTINSGSSSVKFAVFQDSENLKRVFLGKIDNIGSGNSNLSFVDSNGKKSLVENINTSNHTLAAEYLLNWLKQKVGFNSIKAIGHRVVHGMHYKEPQIIDRKLVTKLYEIRPYDPEHLPREIELIETFLKIVPNLLHVACFDTAFHQSMPRVAKILPIPRRFDRKGIQRYGFHGLSYSYLFDKLLRQTENKSMNEKIIMAHLGSGASLAAIKNGKSIDTTMAFTPTAGIPMSSRSGDLDPGLALYLSQNENMSIEQYYKMVNEKSGLLGISETSSDIRDLLRDEKNDIRASEAVSVFCYQVKKYIGAYSAVLGGLDTLVFSGGIGENAPSIRERICSDMEYLGIEIDKSLNEQNEEIISSKQSKVVVRVIATNEELTIAKMVCNMLKPQKEKSVEYEKTNEEKK